MTDPLPFAGSRLSDLIPAERATAVAALLAAGLLRHLRPAAFPPPTGTANSQEKLAESI